MTARELQVAEWSLATAAVAFGAFNAFADNAPTIRARCRDEDAALYLADLRAGYVSAALIAVGTGAVVSLLVESPIPALAAAAGSVAMVAAYEHHVPEPRRLLGRHDRRRSAT